MDLNDSPSVLEGCSTCRHKTEHAFCNLSPEALGFLDRISFTVPYPERAILFSEHEKCRGVFALCSGRAKLTTGSRGGKTLLLRDTEPGEILGLSAALYHGSYDVTAETVSASTVRFVKRDDFVQFLRMFGDSGMQAMRALGREYEHALDNLRSLAWLSTASARVAQLLLQLVTEEHSGNGSGAHLSLTQEQIAQMAATTRETVTRLLMQLRKDRVISLTGSDLIIRNRAALEKMAS